MAPLHLNLKGPTLARHLYSPLSILAALALQMVSTSLSAQPVSEETDAISRDSSETVPSAAEEGPDHPQRFSWEEYRYAEGPWYTLTGKPPYRSTNIDPVPLAITTGALAGIITGIHLYQQDAWWSDRRQPFHFQTDWGYAAQLDKLGHMFAGYFVSYVGYESLIASGFAPSTAGWLGPALAFGFQTYVEIEDGFSPFGFDPTDQAANFLGTGLHAVQHYVPALQNYKLKFSYWPAGDINTPGTWEGHEKIVIDDYNGQSVWLTAKMSNLLPESTGWPDWLRLGLGYGVYDVDRWDSTGLLVPGRRIFIGLDYDLVELMPDLGTFGNWIVQTADILRLPAPALQVVPDLRFYLMYPVTF